MCKSGLLVCQYKYKRYMIACLFSTCTGALITLFTGLFTRASRNGCSIWAWVAARSIGLGSLLDLGWGRWFKMATP